MLLVLLALQLVLPTLAALCSQRLLPALCRLAVAAAHAACSPQLVRHPLHDRALGVPRLQSPQALPPMVLLVMRVLVLMLVLVQVCLALVAATDLDRCSRIWEASHQL